MHTPAAYNLDALCSRYGIDRRRLTKHGALLDAQILAEVYVELLAATASSPTCRRLLTLMAAWPATHAPIAAWASPLPKHDRAAAVDPTPRLFTTIEGRLSETFLRYRL